MSSVIIRSEMTRHCSQAGKTKVPPPRTMRKPSIAPCSSRTLSPNSFLRP